MNATELNKARSLALRGADGIKLEAAFCSIQELQNALAYARERKLSKTTIAALEREARRKAGQK